VAHLNFSLVFFKMHGLFRRSLAFIEMKTACGLITFAVKFSDPVNARWPSSEKLHIVKYPVDPVVLFLAVFQWVGRPALRCQLWYCIYETPHVSALTTTGYVFSSYII